MILPKRPLLWVALAVQCCGILVLACVIWRCLTDPKPAPYLLLTTICVILACSVANIFTLVAIFPAFIELTASKGRNGSRVDH